MCSVCAQPVPQPLSSNPSVAPTKGNHLQVCVESCSIHPKNKTKKTKTKTKTKIISRHPSSRTTHNDAPLVCPQTVQCDACREVWYCPNAYRSPSGTGQSKCQKKHWKVHKPFCKQAKAKAAAAAAEAGAGADAEDTGEDDENLCCICLKVDASRPAGPLAVSTAHPFSPEADEFKPPGLGAISSHFLSAKFCFACCHGWCGQCGIDIIRQAVEVADEERRARGGGSHDNDDFFQVHCPICRAPQHCTEEEDFARLTKAIETRSVGKHTAPALANLSNLLRRGIGCATDIEASAMHLKRSADMGYAPSQNALGNRYLNGEGVRRDEEEAFKYHMLAARQGDAHGIYSVGEDYMRGRGVRQNQCEGVRWLQLACEKEIPTAMHCLAGYLKPHPSQLLCCVTIWLFG